MQKLENTNVKKKKKKTNGNTRESRNHNTNLICVVFMVIFSCFCCCGFLFPRFSSHVFSFRLFGLSSFRFFFLHLPFSFIPKFYILQKTAYYQRTLKLLLSWNFKKKSQKRNKSVTNIDKLHLNHNNYMKVVN